MKRLTPTTQSYAWGSRTLISSLRGAAESEEREAELWYGAHPDAPSILADSTTLLDQIEADPVARLGAPLVERFGNHLPFLLKLLAADTPLSIQAHPTIAQARAGFAREDDAGIARTAPNRNFRDPYHKPELIVAVTPFEAMVGFRDVNDTLEFLGLLGATDLASVLLAHGPRNAVAWLLASRDRDADLVAATIKQITRASTTLGYSPFAGEADLVDRLAAQYPGDPGVAVATLLNRVLLEPGQALYLDAGTLHAYVGGLGVELMANSNNVLRGGLTPKHIDVPVLLDILRPNVGPPVVLHRDESNRYPVPVEEFSLQLVQHATQTTGPAIAVAITGELDARTGDTSLCLQPTEGLWVDAGETVELASTGTGVIAQANI